MWRYTEFHKHIPSVVTFGTNLFFREILVRRFIQSSYKISFSKLDRYALNTLSFVILITCAPYM